MKYLSLLVLLCTFSYAEATESYAQTAARLELLIDNVQSHRQGVDEALLMIEEREVDLLIKPSVIAPENQIAVLEARGVCTGAVQGALCFDVHDIARLKQEKGAVIWVTEHIKNDDLCYLKDIAGILAIKEDPSSHAVIVARVSNIPCLTFPIQTYLENNSIQTPSTTLVCGDLVTLDAFNGKVYTGCVPLHNPQDARLLHTIMDWAEMYAELEIHGNADTAEEAKESLRYGATGVDPRTEHMFFHPERLHHFRKVILSDTKDEAVLKPLEDHQRKDFIDLYSIMKSLPVKIRLLDPPLHEFLPTTEDAVRALANDLEMPFEVLQRKIADLGEVNPMMGHRGVRLLLTYPAILKMQARAIFEAVSDPMLTEYAIKPYIIVPMVINEAEIKEVKKIIDEVRDEVSARLARQIPYHLGTMMETPRACLLAGTIAPYVDCMAFGTNDLTGQTLALSRGDVYDKFLKHYIETGLLPADPFSTLDPAVCQLIKTTVQQTRQTDHYVSIGLCGEQGSEKSGVFACHQLGLDTVSCSPTRIPSVKLFAAQAAILHPRQFHES